ncbi:hypothetical protein JYU20_04040, partial [Bacteroidales bacterium AH-315-I05]|nr:hypothetical protein [Bacteroidales bacterium AH-315-I05]
MCILLVLSSRIDSVFAQPANDAFANAIDVSAFINGCSADAAYTTISGTADMNMGSCWDNAGPLFNVWFTFQATATQINVTVDVGGAKGTQTRTELALWEADGTTQIHCKRYNASGDDVVVGSVGLTVGNWYYISVDAASTTYDGTFTLCLDDVVDYDFYESAIDVSSIINGCSADAIYATWGASGDKSPGSCWNNAGPLFNRWFKFQATATQINVTVDVGGAKGTQTRTELALWEADGTTQIHCKRYNASGDDVVVGSVGLTVGNWYYISVDAASTTYDGTFTLCLDDVVDYDFYEGAIEITNLDNGCSADAIYTTLGGTGDKIIGSCWNIAGPLFNRWFKFKAIHTNASITVDRGGTKGTQRRTQLALWQSDGVTEVSCQRYVADLDDVNIAATGLTVGNWYYISVDAQSTVYDGTFTLCVDNVNDTYYSIATGGWSTATNWSKTSHVGPAAGTAPTISDAVNIEGHTITVSSAQSCGGVKLNVATANTGLIVDGAALTINGVLSMTNTGNNFDGNVTIQNAGDISVNDSATFIR